MRLIPWEMKRNAWKWLLPAVVLCGALLLVITPVHYDDYAVATCQAGDRPLTVTLNGDWGGLLGSNRQSPYYLRVSLPEEPGQPGPSLVLEQAHLVGFDDGHRVDLPDDESNLVDVQREGLRQVFVVPNIALPYQGYVFSGRVRVAGAHADSGAAFSCRLPTAYRAEWRMLWWDAVMSV